jgi:hypothetical protein
VNLINFGSDSPFPSRFTPGFFGTHFLLSPSTLKNGNLSFALLLYHHPPRISSSSHLFPPSLSLISALKMQLSLLALFCLALFVLTTLVQAIPSLSRPRAVGLVSVEEKYEYISASPVLARQVTPQPGPSAPVCMDPQCTYLPFMFCYRGIPREKGSM